MAPTNDLFGDVAATANYAASTDVVYGYDAMGRVTTATYYPGPITISYGHDADGNLTSQLDASGTTTTTYDGLGRPVARSAPNGVNDTYAYDPASNLTAVADAAGTTSYHYNTLNRVDQVTEPSGRIDVLGYNAMGEQSDVWTNTSTSVAYNGTSLVPPTAFATHRHATYDDAGQLASLANTLASNDNNVFSEMSFGYLSGSGCQGQPSGVVTSQIRTEYDYVRNVWNGFCYDNAGRLAGALVDSVFTYYGYDADGNPTSGSLGTHTYNTADQSTDAGYAYDGNGNLTASPTLTAAYNSADQTIGVNATPGTFTQFGYAGAGQATRSYSATSAGSTTFSNGLLGVEAQTDTTGLGTASYVYLPDGTLLAETTPTGAYYYIADNQGSIIGLASTAGTPRATYTYTPYGTQTATAENGALAANPYGYDGGYTDNTGLIHYGARYYDPTTGRWTQLDPSGQSSGYAYTGDDPINSEDPTGLFCIFGHNSSGGCNGGSVAGGAADFFTKSVPGAFGDVGHFAKRHIGYVAAGVACAAAYGAATGGSAATDALTAPEAYTLATALCENAIAFAAAGS
jgi:RHS repeat-associated protein